jgi:adenylylsulfate kinase-like enzyme
MPKLSPEMMHVDDDIEMALESQLVALQRRRHENARWWRNLNRWMISLGVVVIVIIVSIRHELDLQMR